MSPHDVDSALASGEARYALRSSSSPASAPV